MQQIICSGVSRRHSFFLFPLIVTFALKTKSLFVRETVLYRYGPESAEGKGKNYPRIHNIDVLYSSFTKAQEKLKIVGGVLDYYILSEYQMIRFSPVLCMRQESNLRFSCDPIATKPTVRKVLK